MSLAFGFALPHWQAISGGAFSPASLFLGGTVAGAWYDPSDLSTMFTTSAGTTPVAMPGQGSAVSVGLMLDKSQGLVLGSELITPAANRDFSSDTGYWTKETGVTISGGTANWSATANSDLYRLNVLTVGKWYRITWTISSYTSGNFRLSVGGTTGALRTAAGTYTETYYAASNGTFAITGQSSATGSIDNISVRELPGNHAIAFNNTTARPELRARVNLLTYSEEFNLWSSAGTTVSANATTAPDGTLTADKMVETATTGLHYRLVGSLTTQVASYTLSVSAKAAERKWLILWYSGSGGFEPYAYFDLENGVIGNKSVSAVASILPQSNGFYRCQITITGQAISNASFVVSVSDADNNNPNQTYLGDSSKGIFVWGADLRPANIGANVPAYQRIADANTYDTSGFPLYLRFDGIDDSMYTPANLNLSGTDKVAVFAGVRYLGADVSNSLIAELSADYSFNNSAFGAWARLAFNSFSYAFASKGTAIASAGALQAAYVPPITSVYVGNGDISGDSAILRINGTQAAISTADQGSGNYGTYPLFIGSRNNTTLYFNGHLHSLIIAGSAVSAGNISATEQWVAGKTGLVLP